MTAQIFDVDVNVNILAKFQDSQLAGQWQQQHLRAWFQGGLAECPHAFGPTEFRRPPPVAAW